MDNAFLVRVLDGGADLHEKPETLGGGKLILVAVVRDGHAPDQFHHEVWPAALGGPRVQHPGDVRMIHQRQRLALGLKPGDDLASVHPRLDNLEGDLAMHRLFLLRHEHPAKAPFADFLQQLVAANDGARPLANRPFFRRHDRLLKEVARPFVSSEEPFYFGPEQWVVLANGIKVGGPCRWRILVGSFRQDFFQSLVFDAHKRSALILSCEETWRFASRSLRPNPFIEPGPGEDPGAVGGAAAQAEQVRGLLLRQPGEEPQLDQVRRGCIQLRQAIQALHPKPTARRRAVARRSRLHPG